MGQPLITVIMPLRYYHPDFFKKSVQSIIQQSCPDWKLLVVVEENDFAKLTALFEEQFSDTRVDIIVNQGWRFPGAINTGMKNAKTDFVAILLADDMWSGNAVEILNKYIAEFPKINFFHSSRIIIDENDRPISPIY